MAETRRSRRFPCRLPCSIIVRSREPIAGHVVDVSEGGLRFISPVAIEPDESLSLQIEVPALGSIDVHALAWHVKPVDEAAERMEEWSVGAVIVTADDGYSTLLVEFGSREDSPDNETTAVLHESPIEQFLFKVRLKKRATPRTRLLRITAASEQEAKSLATEDLDDSWTVVEVKRA